MLRKITVPEKRYMTEQEEQIYRLVHHDFEGLTQVEAAERAGLTQSNISRILKKIEKEHPELFPILNSRQDLIYTQIVGHGSTHQAIADMMDISIRTVERIVSQMRRKGVSFNSPVKTVPYREHMDGDVKFTY